MNPVLLTLETETVVLGAKRDASVRRGMPGTKQAHVYLLMNVQVCSHRSGSCISVNECPGM